MKIFSRNLCYLSPPSAYLPGFFADCVCCISEVALEKETLGPWAVNKGAECFFSFSAGGSGPETCLCIYCGSLSLREGQNCYFSSMDSSMPWRLTEGQFSASLRRKHCWPTESSGSQAVILEGAEIRLGTEGISLLTEYRKCLSRRRMERSHPCQATLIDGSGDIIVPPARHLRLW